MIPLSIEGGVRRAITGTVVDGTRRLFRLKAVFGIVKMKYCESAYAKTRRSEGIHHLERIDV